MTSQTGSQALDQPGRGALAGDPVEVALAEVAEELAGGQQVEGGDEQLVGDGHERPHWAATGAQAVVLVAVVAAFGPHRSRGSGEQGGFEEYV